MIAFLDFKPFYIIMSQYSYIMDKKI